MGFDNWFKLQFTSNKIVMGETCTLPSVHSMAQSMSIFIILISSLAQKVSYHIQISLVNCTAYHLTRFYRLGSSVTKDLNKSRHSNTGLWRESVLTLLQEKRFEKYLKGNFKKIFSITSDNQVLFQGFFEQL